MQLQRVDVGEVRGSITGRLDSVSGIVPIVNRLAVNYNAALDEIERLRAEVDRLSAGAQNDD